MADEDTTLNGEGAAAEHVDSEDTTDTDAANAEGSDIPAEEGADAPIEEEPVVVPDPVPYDRFKEVNDERNALRESVGTMSQQITQLTSLITKQQEGGKVTEKEQDKAQNALDALIDAGEITRDDATKLQKVVDAMGFARASKEEDPRLKGLESTVQKLLQKDADKADRDELSSTLTKYDGVVTQQDIEAKMKEFYNSGNPKLKKLAETGTYEEIVREGFFDKIVQHEAGKITAGRPKPAPKIDPSKQITVKKPAEEELLFDPANPRAYDRALRKAVIAKAREPAE